MSAKLLGVKWNPRWLNALFERALIIHEPNQPTPAHISECDRVPETWPPRYENAQDFYDGKPPIPRWIAVYDDGREVESN